MRLRFALCSFVLSLGITASPAAARPVPRLRWVKAPGKFPRPRERVSFPAPPVQLVTRFEDAKQVPPPRGLRKRGLRVERAVQLWNLTSYSRHANDLSSTPSVMTWAGALTYRRTFVELFSFNLSRRWQRSRANETWDHAGRVSDLLAPYSGRVYLGRAWIVPKGSRSPIPAYVFEDPMGLSATRAETYLAGDRERMLRQAVNIRAHHAAHVPWFENVMVGLRSKPHRLVVDNLLHWRKAVVRPTTASDVVNFVDSWLKGEWGPRRD